MTKTFDDYLGLAKELDGELESAETVDDCVKARRKFGKLKERAAAAAEENARLRADIAYALALANKIMDPIVSTTSTQMV
jgi:hypothetical protein